MARDLNLGLSIDFQPALQSGLIQNRGSDMLHEIGMACAACRTEDVFEGMQGDGKTRRSPNCEVCIDGWLFRSPLVIRGLVTSVRQQKNIIDAGLAAPGDMLFSPEPPDTECDQENRRYSQDDKFTATWSQPLQEGQTIVRGAATFRGNNVLNTQIDITEDRLWYEPESALWCEDENGRVYLEDSDFELGPGKVIRWIGTSPVMGERYTLKYNAFFEWLAFAPPQERRDRDNRDIGPLIFLRKRHIAFVNSSPIIKDDDRIDLQSRLDC